MKPACQYCRALPGERHKPDCEERAARAMGTLVAVNVPYCTACGSERIMHPGRGIQPDSVRVVEYPEGFTPTDARVLREANGKLAEENQRMRQALRFYARGQHYAGFETWEGPSGDDNWLCPPSKDDDRDYQAFLETLEQHMVEEGSLARRTLLGKPINWDGEEPEPIEGEPEYAITESVSNVARRDPWHVACGKPRCPTPEECGVRGCSSPASPPVAPCNEQCEPNGCAECPIAPPDERSPPLWTNPAMVKRLCEKFGVPLPDDAPVVDVHQAQARKALMAVPLSEIALALRAIKPDDDVTSLVGSDYPFAAVALNWLAAVADRIEAESPPKMNVRRCERCEGRGYDARIADQERICCACNGTGRENPYECAGSAPKGRMPDTRECNRCSFRFVTGGQDWCPACSSHDTRVVTPEGRIP